MVNGTGEGKPVPRGLRSGPKAVAPDAPAGGCWSPAAPSCARSMSLDTATPSDEPRQKGSRRALVRSIPQRTTRGGLGCDLIQQVTRAYLTRRTRQGPEWTEFLQGAGAPIGASFDRVNASRLTPGCTPVAGLQPAAPTRPGDRRASGSAISLVGRHALSSVQTRSVRV